MNGLWRIVAAIVALPMTAFALSIALKQFQSGFDPMGATFGCSFATVAIVGWWFALRGHRPESRAHMRIALTGGLILGGISFAVGFFGPIVWAPDANQGPLLGIFFTGPLGFALGTVMGWLYTRLRPSRTIPGDA